MSNMTGDVSVVIPCFNSSATIGRALASVEKQSLPVGEVIIVDDGSKDFAATEKVCESFSSLPLNLIRLEENKGAPFARNVGAENATMKYVALLDSDDVWFPDKIKLQLHVMSRGDYVFSSHNYYPNLRHYRQSHVGERYLETPLSLRHFWFANPICTPTVMFRRDSAIRFPQAFRRCDDYICWVTCLSDGARAVHLSATLAGGWKRPIGGSGLTASVSRMHEDYMNALKHLSETRRVPRLFYLAAVTAEAMKYPLRVVNASFYRAAVRLGYESSMQ